MAGVTEDSIYVAVGKDVKECKSILIWALQNSGGKRICILHVHQPSQFVPFMGARAPASSMREDIVKEHQGSEREKMFEIMDEYVLICSQMGTQAQKLVTETDSVEKGIVELVSEHGIRKLVMGAAAEKYYKRKMMELKSNKAKYVREQAPSFCRTQFICKGYLIFTREAIAATGTRQSNPTRSLSVNLLYNRDSPETGQSKYLRSQSDILALKKNSNGISIYDIPVPEGTEELLSPKSISDAGGNVCDTLSRSSPDLDSSSHSSKGVADVTPTSWKDGNEYGSEFGIFSSGVDIGCCLLKSSPSLISSSSTISSCSSSGALTVAEGSFDNTLHEKLTQAMAEAENEALKRRKAEKDMIEALCRAKEELKQRQQIEEALVKEKEELAKVKNHRDQLMEELRISQERETSLKSQIEVLQKTREELRMECDSAVKEAEALRKKLGDASSRQMNQFSEFTLSEIKEATQSFNDSLKIGHGGYGNIYKGLLHQTEVAIKMLQCHDAHGTSQFQMEVRVLSKLSHPNLVQLIGSCPEVFALVYEYLPNGSLEDRVNCRNNSPPLSWQTRIRIATELCSVLIYLHSAEPHSIVHGDLKPSNVLLDANFVSKLSDFGISRLLFPDTSSSSNMTLSHVTVPKGTMAYIDPEFLETGVLTLKADVYSFGIILLRLLTGKSAFSISYEVKSALDAGSFEALLDPSAGEWSIAVAQKLARLALRCCDRNRKNRPDLGSDVWKVLAAIKAQVEPHCHDS